MFDSVEIVIVCDNLPVSTLFLSPLLTSIQNSYLNTQSPFLNHVERLYLHGGPNALFPVILAFLYQGAR